MSTLAEPDALYAGLISGTSMDCIDAALVRLGDRQCEVIATHAHPYPAELRASLLNVSRNHLALPRSSGSAIGNAR